MTTINHKGLYSG